MTAAEPALLFNSPLECGLRAAVLLVECYPQELDIQRLVNYDYLLVHSGDLNGPPSLHPDSPHRSGELLVKRPIIEAGVSLMMTKSIIECVFSPAGIRYHAGNWALSFLAGINAPYCAALRERARWVAGRFAAMSDDDLRAYMAKRWSVWGAEFELQGQALEDEE
jgi:hypothetical protein